MLMLAIRAKQTLKRPVTRIQFAHHAINSVAAKRVREARKSRMNLAQQYH